MKTYTFVLLAFIAIISQCCTSEIQRKNRQLRHQVDSLVHQTAQLNQQIKDEQAHSATLAKRHLEDLEKWKSLANCSAEEKHLELLQKLKEAEATAKHHIELAAKAVARADDHALVAERAKVAAEAARTAAQDQAEEAKEAVREAQRIADSLADQAQEARKALVDCQNQ